MRHPLEHIDTGELAAGDHTHIPTSFGEWTDFTPTGSWTTNTTYTGEYRREGDSIRLRIHLALAGAPTSATLTIDIPLSLTVDEAKLSLGTGASKYVGRVMVTDLSAVLHYGSGIVFYNTTNNNLNPYSSTTDAQAVITQAAPVTFASGDAIQMEVLLPITGWGS